MHILKRNCAKYTSLRYRYIVINERRGRKNAVNCQGKWTRILGNRVTRPLSKAYRRNDYRTYAWDTFNTGVDIRNLYKRIRGICLWIAMVIFYSTIRSIYSEHTSTTKWFMDLNARPIHFPSTHVCRSERASDTQKNRESVNKNCNFWTVTDFTDAQLCGGTSLGSLIRAKVRGK